MTKTHTLHSLQAHRLKEMPKIQNKYYFKSSLALFKNSSANYFHVSWALDAHGFCRFKIQFAFTTAEYVMILVESISIAGTRLSSLQMENVYVFAHLMSITNNHTDTYTLTPRKMLKTGWSYCMYKIKIYFKEQKKKKKSKLTENELNRMICRVDIWFLFLSLSLQFKAYRNWMIFHAECKC